MGNLFEKIQNVRNDLQKANIKMTGKNTYAGYEYFELADFLKPLNELMAKYQMTAIPSFTSDLATLTAINCEDTTERFTISSPFSSASLKGCYEVQNIGAVETYQRRYLYQAMFDIAESDSLNATQGQSQSKGQNEGKTEKKGVEKTKSDLPFPEQGVSETKPTRDEIKAERQSELMSLNSYYPELNQKQWLDVLKELQAEFGGKRFADMSETEYKKVVSKITNKEI